MGLDMYLYVTKNVYPHDFEHEDGKMTRKDNPMFNRIIESAELDKTPTPEYGSIKVDKCVGYWRKANAVHGWIVRNCANGVDECQRISMSREDLKNLRNACVKELDNRSNALPDVEPKVINEHGENAEQVAQSIMDVMKSESAKAHTTVMLDDPLDLVPTAGFFFGSTSKDEYYYHSIEYTLDLMNSLLAYLTDDDYVYYEASW